MGDPSRYPEIRMARHMYALQWLPREIRDDRPLLQQWIDNNMSSYLPRRVCARGLSSWRYLTASAPLQRSGQTSAVGQPTNETGQQNTAPGVNVTGRITRRQRSRYRTEMPPVASLVLNLSIAVALITPPAADITVTSRRAVLGACAAAAMFTSHKAAAWCGETVPSWAFYLKWDDDPALPFEYAGTQGKFYCRVVGDVAREKKVGLTARPAACTQHLKSGLFAEILRHRCMRRPACRPW
eukprot:scaffold4855_cov115-Isochrysis_galbana.AAC.2